MLYKVSVFLIIWPIEGLVVRNVKVLQWPAINCSPMVEQIKSLDSPEMSVSPSLRVLRL